MSNDYNEILNFINTLHTGIFKNVHLINNKIGIIVYKLSSLCFNQLNTLLTPLSVPSDILSLDTLILH